MSNDERSADTPTGVAIPRPQRLPGAATKEPPRTVEDVYRLIDERLPVNIPIDVVERLSSEPPPAKAEPRPSLPVRAVKGGSKWTAFVVAGFTLLGQVLALWAAPEYRGPIVQTAKLVAVVVSKALADDPTAPPTPATPELLPEPPPAPPRPAAEREPGLAPPPALAPEGAACTESWECAERLACVENVCRLPE